MKADGSELLAGTKTVYLVDWPSRDVPDTLARSGLTVVSSDGPDEYHAYEVAGDAVRLRTVNGPPARADLVYTHRPIEELPEILETAKVIGAKALWFQSGLDDSGARDPRGCWLSPDESVRARKIVEGAGLTYLEAPYIADAVRTLRTRAG